MATPPLLYKFFRTCGHSAEISNDGRTAHRKPHSELNNAVLIGNDPLVEGASFKVRVDKKDTTRTGSIIIGVTTTVPERFKFPQSVTSLTEGCWILSGSSVLKDGKQSVPNYYAQQSAQTLREGDALGVMRRGGALHFVINGQDLGCAAKELPGKVYPIVDLCGQCVQVTVVQPGGQAPQNTALHSECSTPPVLGQLCFHTRAGTNVDVVDGGMRAQRKAVSSEFNNAVVITNRPLKDDELFEVQLKGTVDKWAGSIEIGLTTYTPTTLSFPSTLTNLSTGVWLISGSSVIHNRDTVCDDIGSNLDQLQVGDYVGVMRNSSCTMTLYVNGREVGVVCNDIPSGVYGVADLYGRCVEVAMANRTQNNSSSGERTGMGNGSGNLPGGRSQNGQDAREWTGNQEAPRSEPLRTTSQRTEHHRTENERTGNQQAEPENQRSENQQLEVNRGSRTAGGVEPVAWAAGGTRPSQDRLRFHTHCGVNVELSGDRTQATRRHPYALFTAATVFTSRPLLPGEWFEVVVSNRIECWNGSMQMGVTSTPPDNVAPATEAMNTDNSWLLCGHVLHHQGNELEPNCGLDLNEVPGGATVGVMVTSDGDLHFSVNGQDMGCAARGVPTGVYGMVDIYGQCTQVVIQQQHDITRGGHVTSRGGHMTAATSLQPITQSMDGVTIAPTTQIEPNAPAVRCSLHSKCGANVQLSDNGTVATRVHSYKDGVVFSAHPLKVEEMFKVEVVKIADNWKGFLRIGLTTCVPDSFELVPSLSTALPRHTWVVNGTTVTANGSTVMETYGAALCRLQVGDTVGIKLHSDLTMHIHLNGEDLGIAATINGITEKLYAVVDLYGPILVVKLVGTQFNAVTSQASPELMKTHTAQPVVDLEEAVTFASKHGDNIRLEHGGQSACRFKSYSRGVVMTSSPLPSDRLFQVEIKEIDPKWTGSLSIGVTALPPAQVISVTNAKQLPGQSFVIASSGAALYIGGQEVDHLPGDVKDLALKVGDMVGLLYKSSGTLHFFLNGTPVAKFSCTVPTGAYGLVDLYGQCVKVALRPLTPWSEDTSYLRNASLNQQKLFSIQAGATGSVLDLLLPTGADTTAAAAAAVLPVVPRRQGGSNWEVQESGKCAYQNLCNRLVCNGLLLPEAYFALEEGGVSLCLCKDCCVRQEVVRSAGNPRRRYTLPHGWVQYKLKLPPRAESLRAEEEWNVAYHGTAVGNARSILDCGGLLLPGDRMVRGNEVKRPEGHYTDDFKPQGFDVNRIFLTPSARYCGLGEVYTKPCRHNISGKEYVAKVMFGVLVRPGSFDVSAQTVDPKNATIDEHFGNNELEWSTKHHVSIILHNLYVKLEPL